MYHTSIYSLTKTKKTLLKSVALRAIVCYRHESGCKYTYSIFLPITSYVLLDINTFKKKNKENHAALYIPISQKYSFALIGYTL